MFCHTMSSKCKWSWTRWIINAGWSYRWSVHVGRWRKRAHKEGATVQLWWLTTCTLYTSFREWSCSLLKQTRIVLITALGINCCKSAIWNHWEALKVLNNFGSFVTGYAYKTPPLLGKILHQLIEPLSYEVLHFQTPKKPMVPRNWSNPHPALAASISPLTALIAWT